MEESGKGIGLRWLLLKLCLVSLVKEDARKDDNSAGDAETSEEKCEMLTEDLPSIVDLKKVIPKHCFEPKVSTSLGYVIVDIVGVVMLYLSYQMAQSYLPLCLVCAVTPVYWLLQGTFFTAIFVLGHDCGHGSFSKHDVLNDVMGTVLHTFVMVPYYCWKLSHRNHHRNTGNIDKDEVFYPTRKKDCSGKGLLLPGFGLGFGWYAYMVTGYGSRPIPHFNIFHRMFSKHFLACAVSVACIGVWVAILCQYAMIAGWISLLNHYIIPAFVFGSWGVIFTFLHHSDETVPWFSNDQWDFLRGQLSSVDRDYGWAHSLTHAIGTHQIHHLFTKVPHYHLTEATEAFRKNFPHLVRYSSAPIIPTFIKMFRKYVKQNVIGDDVAVHYYR